ncbi:MAG TPA: Lrp/AsnC family transcriptional regulator [Gammaproteobacteria bacterium]|nr:Lrp/AsnC family transcriptional regulator [Gammaproteobacteria bacterium]
MAVLDRIDRRILALLQRDGRMTNAELASHANLSPSACHRRVQLLRERGIIKGFAVLVDGKAIGRSTNVLVEVTLKSQSEETLDSFEKAVRSVPHVMECYLMAGDADYFLRIVAANAQDYERIHRQYLSRLPGVARIRTSFALRTIREEHTLRIDDY